MDLAHLDTNISKVNVDRLISTYCRMTNDIGNPFSLLKGLPLLEAIKRKKLPSVGPYKNVTFFEAANRIMSDLVILYGVRWLLTYGVFPFNSYSVQYGTENRQPFDIIAQGQGKSLAGEAFNVAHDFFQSKKTATLKKLREPGVRATYKIIMFNHDAPGLDYKPRPRENEFFVFVRVGQDNSYMIPSSRERS